MRWQLQAALKSKKHISQPDRLQQKAVPRTLGTDVIGNGLSKRG
jgi:hypothetical protein